MLFIPSLSLWIFFSYFKYIYISQMDRNSTGEVSMLKIIAAYTDEKDRIL
jgi:hypothetical protein